MRKIILRVCLSLAAIIFVAFLAVWISSPFVVRYLANEALAPMQVKLGNGSRVVVNPFLSQVTVSNVKLLNDSNDVMASLGHAKVGISPWRLVFRQIYLSEFEFAQLDVNISYLNDVLMVAGMALTSTEGEPAAEFENNAAEPSSEPQASSESSAFSVRLPEGTLQQFDFNFQYENQPIRITIDEFNVDDVTTSVAQQSGAVQMRGSLNGAPFLIFTDFETVQGTGDVTLEFALSEFDFESVQPILSDLGVSLSGLFSVSANTNIQFNDLNYALRASSIELAWAELVAEYPPWLINNTGFELSFNDVFLSAENDVTTVAASLAMLVENFEVALEATDNQLVSIGELAIPVVDIAYGEQAQIEIESITFNDVIAMTNRQTEYASRPPVLSFNSLQIQELLLTETSSDVASVFLDGLAATIELDDSATLVGMTDLDALTADASVTESAETSSQAEASSAEEFTLKLGEFNLLTPAVISVLDESVTPAFEKKIAINEFHVGEVNSENSGWQTPIRMTANTDEFDSIVLNATVQPFAEKLNAQAELALTEFALPPVSPYVSNALALDVKSGQLTTELNLTIVDDELDGATDLFIQAFKLGSTETEGTEVVASGSAISLNAALNMLKDNDDNLELRIPISGDVSDPSFGVQNFIALVLKKAAMQQAKSFLLNAMVPYAKVVSISLSGAEELLKVRFEPLEFLPADSELPQAQMEYVNQLTLYLQEEENLTVKLCPVATPEELGLDAELLDDEQRTRLTSLADQRHSALKSFLVEQGIESARLVACLAEIDDEEAGVGRVEIQAI